MMVELSKERRTLNRLLKSVHAALVGNETREKIDDYRLELKAQWTQLAHIIDMILATIFFGATIGGVIFIVFHRAPKGNIM